MRPRPEQLRELREYPILYVDDEPENLRIFELTFGREFSIRTATSGEEGLEILRSQPIAMVLSDHRMPGMTGTEFLAQTAQLDSKIVRVMVTAYGDVETLQGAINSGSIYRFIPKPWMPEDVRATLRRGIEAYALDRERDQLLRELTLLNRVSASLSHELELDRLLDLLLSTLVEEMEYDAAGLFLFDPTDGSLRLSRMFPSGEPVEAVLRQLRITVGRSPQFMGPLLDGNSHKLRVAEVLGYDSCVRELVAEVAAEEMLVSPLYGKEGLVGAITIDNRRGGESFSADDRVLLEGVSNQAVVAIENARLVEDLRRSREQVRRADRLSVLGALAADLAQEINEPLLSLHSFLRREGRLEEAGEFGREPHERACRAIDRIRAVVETMDRLGSAGAAAAARETVDTASVVAEVVKLLRREAQLGRVALRVECDREAPKIVAVRDQIHQAVLNLLLNAIAATPEGGEVSVRTIGMDHGVRLEVRDRGAGIPEEHIDQIFDPFFTTKGPEEEGLGLGLLICHRIVADHGGSIEVHSSAGEGTTLSLCLPSE